MKKIIFILILTLIFSGCGEATKTAINTEVNNNSQTNSSLPEVYQAPVVQLGLMIHLEGWDNEINNEKAFKAHTQGVRDFAAILNKAGAKGTFEASPEFVKACDKWGDNVMLELIQQGHGIGVHADVGGNPRENLSFDQFVNQIGVMKKDLEQLTGQEVLHVSGICSEQDWVRAASNAGYKFTTGAVGYCAMSLPSSKRPDQYTDCPNPGACHGVIPLDLADRIHPWHASTGTDWLKDDPDGSLVILPSNSVLKNIIEDDQLNQEDIDVYVNQLEEIISLAEPNQVNLSYYGLSMGSIDFDQNIYQKWLESIQPYIDSGQAEWKTLPEIYQAYID